LDHADIIAAISDGRGSLVRVSLDEGDDRRLLRGGAPAAHDGGAAASQFQELILVVLETELKTTTQGRQMREVHSLRRR